MSANTNHPLAQAPLDELAAELRRRRAALPKLIARREQLRTDLEMVESQIEALERIDGDTPSTFRAVRVPRSAPASKRTSGRVTMRTKIAEVLGMEPMRPVEIAEALVDRGLHRGTKSLQVQVSSTLAKFPDFERVSRGQWIRLESSPQTVEDASHG